MSKTYYLTTAIAYTSQKPHIGNTYEIVLSDAIARYKRMQGYDVRFQTGTDEHGQKIELSAKEAGISPKEYVDKIAGELKKIWDLMDTTYDRFIRTTDEDHKKVVQKIFEKLYEQGDIYKGEYKGMYCVPCESFFTESQLVGGNCPDCGRPVKEAKEEAYFFKMSKYQDRLMKHIEKNPGFIEPESRKREMINNFLKPGLQDLCVSRTSFTWGVQVDFDPKHVVYVWIDALSNYITGLGYDPDGSSELFEKYWPADVHIIGKDILRFHTIYWPIMLMALDLPLPKKIFGHPWFLSGGEKMSKSKGNVMYADELAKYFGVDAVRYYLLHEMPFSSDGNITYETIIARFNSDLANTIGNLVNRTVAMCQKYFNGEVLPPNTPSNLDKELVDTALSAFPRYCAAMDGFHVADALDEIMALARRSNKYIDETMPWALAKDETQKGRLGTVLYHLLESIRFIAVMIEPFMPSTCNAVFEQLGSDVRSFDSLKTFNGVKAGSKVGTPTPLFNRIDESKMLAEIEAGQVKKDAVKPAVPETKQVEGVAQIGIEDFAKVSLKVALIKECEKVEKSDKLLKLLLDDGEGSRQVVSGIAAWYTPSDLIGKKIVVVANLKPAKLRGVESNGMILAADSGDGVSVIFVDDSVPTGSKVR